LYVFQPIPAYHLPQFFSILLEILAVLRMVRWSPKFRQVAKIGSAP
jgi:hypothetical protein